GFVSTHYAYDTVGVFGLALQDDDFNRLNGTEGTGMDVVHYAIPVNGNAGTLEVSAKFHYQTINDKWLEDVFSYSSDEIDLFEQMYDEADKEPVLVAESNLTSLATALIENENINLKIFPNPANQYLYVNSSAALSGFKLRDAGGKVILEDSFQISDQPDNYKINLPEADGIFFLELFNEGNSLATRKVLIF
ncbi:MAG: T9SS type A sorting domain-containing protein, partial [Bacteroidales bacterium]|nr:T9SS type A sorting domain-containing protein [Bacteroidales bacterium]